MAVFNPFLPSFQADPYPQYAALRAAEPVHFSPALQAWVLTGYEDCALVLRDDETFSSSSDSASGQLAQVLQQQRREFPLGETPTVLNSDPPVHTRLRTLLNHAFTPRAIEGLRPRIEEIAASLLADTDASDGRFDVATGFAQPLPIIVIAELLGVPPEDRDRFRRWSAAIARATDVLNTPAILDAAREATTELIAYMDEVVARRRHAPEADILTALSQAEEDGERLSHEELLAFSILLLLAGHETTSNLNQQRAARPRRAPGAGRAPARRPVAAALDGRGAAALRQRRAGCRALRAPPDGTARPHDRAGRGPAAAGRGGQPATRRSSAIPTSSTSPARRTATSRSGAASTSASAPRSPAAKARSPSPRCSITSPSCVSPRAESSAPARCCCAASAGSSWRSDAVAPSGPLPRREGGAVRRPTRRALVE